MAELAPVEANAEVARYLERGAQPVSSELSRSDPALDSWELRCHPDLVERVGLAAEGLALAPRYVRGLPVLVHANGVAFAVAAGTSLLLLRLPVDARDDVTAGRWAVDGLDDRSWATVEPWLDLPGRAPLERLAGWLARAHEHAAGLA